MKNLKKLSLLLMISMLAVSCGKDNESGGSGSSSTAGILTNPGFIDQVPQGSSQAYQALTTWYQSSQEGQLYQTHQELTYSTPSQGQNQNCNSWLGGFIQFCGSASMGTSTVIARKRTCFEGQGNSPKLRVTNDTYDYYCQNTQTQTTYSKASNTSLGKLLSMNNGAWQVYQATKQGTKIIVHVGPKVNSQNNQNNYYYNQPTATNVYVIDTSLHSAHNPIESHDLVNGTIKVKQ